MRLEHNLQMATRTREPVSLIMLDLDNFKGINDKAGHEAGDVALCMLSEILRTGLRAVDTVARFGGDEFVIILPRADSEGATVVAERMRNHIQQIDVPGFGPVTASFGIATFPNHASSQDALMGAADRALYDAKDAGRDRVCVFDIVAWANNRPSGELTDAMQRL
jgi:diguanylate cyclase (GGDEF)-like protein